MSNFKKNSKANKHVVTSTGLSLQGSQINLSTRLSNLNISNPLHYLYNENVDTPSRGRPMSALTLSATYQESPRKSRLVKRPQSADTINKINKSRHISFDFNDQQIDTGIVNRVDRTESVFDESDGAELSSSSDGHLTPVPPNDGIGDGDGDGQPSLEPGLTSKPPIPPGGGDARLPETFGRVANGSATFDDAVELKFQRWFPNSAPVLIPVPSPATDVHVESVISGGSGSVGDGRTVAYAKSGRSQLDEENLYSNLSAAIGGASDRFGGSVSVDLSGALRGSDADSDRGRIRSIAKPKIRSKKKIAPVVAATVGHRSKNIKDTLKSKQVAAATVQPVEAAVAARNEQPPERQPEVRRDRPKNAERSPVQDYVREDVVSWMSSHLQRPSTPELNSHTFDAFCKEKHETTTYDEIVNILKELESENNDIGS